MPPEPLANLTILVVEDHDDARKYIEKFLQQVAANVIGARNAIDGFEAVKVHRPTLVLSDITMSGDDGFKLLRKIRALERVEARAIPVIAMTALVSAAEGRQILHVGFRAYLPMPFTPERLLATIQSVLIK